MWLWSFPTTAILAKRTQIILMGDGMKDMQGIDGAKLIWNVECLSCHQTESEHAYGAPGKLPTVRYRQGNYLNHLHHDALELCFLWNRCISGRRYAFSTSSASAKSIAHGCFEAKSSFIQNGFSTSRVLIQHCLWPWNLAWQMLRGSGLMSIEHIGLSMLPITRKQPHYGMTFGKLKYGANYKAILLESGVISFPIS